MRYLPLRPFSHEFHPTPVIRPPTPLIRPMFLGPLMTLLTGFHCNSEHFGVPIADPPGNELYFCVRDFYLRRVGDEVPGVARCPLLSSRSGRLGGDVSKKACGV